MYFCKLNRSYLNLQAEKQEMEKAVATPQRNFLVGEPPKEKLQFLYQDNLIQDLGKKIIIVVNNFYD